MRSNQNTVEHVFEHCLTFGANERHIQFMLTRLHHDKQQDGILITLHDISKHKSTEQALHLAKGRVPNPASGD